MSAYILWFENYRFSYASDSTVFQFPEELALKTSRFTWGQFLFTTDNWMSSSGTAEIQIKLESSVDGFFWLQQSTGISLTPGDPDGQLFLNDANATASVVGMGRYVRPVFIGDDGANPGSVGITARALLKRL